MSRQLSPAVALAVDLLRRGEVDTIRKAAAITGAARSSVAEACVRRQIVSRTKAARQRATQQRERGAELVQEGLTVTAAASLLGVSPPTVQRACRSAGVEYPRSRRRVIDRAALRRVWHLVIRGELTTGDLARRWGVSRSAIRQAARSEDLAPAPRPRKVPRC